MRVDATAEATSSTAGLLEIMDDFAGLRTGGADAAIAGYRLLHPRKPGRHALRAAALMLTGRRLRATGFLATVFAASLGLAVLAGPATCPCDTIAAGDPPAETQSLARLSYTTHDLASDISAPSNSLDAATIASPVELSGNGEPPALSTLALVEPDTGAASISTSALDRPREEAAPAPTRDTLETRRDGLPEKIEQLSDRAPIELGARSTGAEPSAPPEVVAATPPTSDITAIETDIEPAAQTPRKQASPKRRNITVRAYAPRNRTPAAVNTPGPDKHAVPRWAQKMFETPWQTKAFSFQ